MGTDAQVLLTGATGYIGGCLLRRLEEGGRAVRCLVRQPARLTVTRSSTDVVQGDCLDEASLEFEVSPIDGGQRSLVRQTATFDPRGLIGRAYWFAISPVHDVMFRGMLDQIARRRAAGRCFS